MVAANGREAAAARNQTLDSKTSICLTIHQINHTRVMFRSKNHFFSIKKPSSLKIGILWEQKISTPKVELLLPISFALNHKYQYIVKPNLV